MTQKHYYQFDGIPCHVSTHNGGKTINAEGYFPGKGFLPVAVTDVLFHGEMMTEKEFKSFVVELRNSYRP